MITKFGFYKVGEFVTTSKIEAIELHNRTGIHPEWVFNNTAFANANWEREPDESLSALYAKRCQQLREKYDYLVLFFSGGADSTNILHHFVSNGIHIDELISYHSAEAASKDGFGEQEIFKVAIPAGNKAREINPSIKHRIVDISKLTVDYYNDKDNNILYDINDCWTPHHLGLSQIMSVVPEWKDIANQGRTIGFIHGIDKPRLFVDKTGYYVKFLDLLISNNIDLVMIRDQHFGNSHELFYWSPDMPELIIKQAHILKKFVDLHKIQNTVPGQVRTQDLPHDVIHELIYPTWDKTTFTQGKVKASMIASPRDLWFFKLSNSLALSNYQKSLQEIQRITGAYWLNDRSNVFGGLKGMWSPHYYLVKNAS